MRALSIIGVMCLLAVWCVSLWAGNKPVSDDSIHDKVMVKLAGDTTVKGGAINVEVHNGVVTLRGKVDQEKARNKAEHLAKKIDGVKKVVNELTVEKP
jgi:osmotically-inducible protein OsmY